MSACTVQLARESGTQTNRAGLYIDGHADVVVVARPYFEADQLHKLREQKARIIQCFVRGWVARKLARKVREELERRRREQAERDAARVEHAERQRSLDLNRRMYPKSPEDFEMLFRELEGGRVGCSYAGRRSHLAVHL